MRPLSIRRLGIRAAILPGVALMAACGGPQCKNEAFFGLPSPDGASIAFVFHRICTGKGGVTTDVSILDSHTPLRNAPGNVLSVGNEQPVRAAWLGPKTLRVAGFTEPVYRRDQQVGSYTIEFNSAAAGK